jgi:CO/xanthine dehydrogenase Mo-binding subunit
MTDAPYHSRKAEPERARLPGSLNVNRRLSQWIHIRPEGRVTVTPGKVEIGQGILTALAQIAAEELDVALERIELRPASVPTSPDEGVTSGSRSIQESGLALRHACASARAIYLSIVAQRTGVSIGKIRVEDGAFIGPAGEIGSYWSLADDAILDCEAPGDARPKTSSERRIAGTAAARLDLPDKVFGAPRFIQDLRLPGMRFARIVRPPSRAARLVEAPASIPEGRLVVDGSFVAVVCDDDIAAGRAAEKLRPLLRWEEHDTLPDEGDVAAALRAIPAETTIIAERSGAAAPARTLRAEFFRPYVAHASIGLVCAVARFDGGRLEVWTQSQSIYNLRRDLGLALRMPQDAIAVHHREGAGCYGHNGADDVALDAALLARALPGAPVRVLWTRADELAWAPLAAAMLVTVEAGVDKAGNLVSWRQDVTGNGHVARPGTAKGPSLLAAAHIAEPFPVPVSINPPASSGGGADRNSIPIYETGALRVELHRLLEMPLRTSSFRALGAMANVLAIETVMDELAREAGRDAAEYRLAHLKDERARETIRAVLDLAGPPGPRREGVGRGLAFARYKGNSAYCAVVAEIEAEAEIRVRRLWIAADAGEVINPEGAAHQIEGGAVQAVSVALKERVRFDRRRVTSESWETYPILRFSEVPRVELRLLPRPDETPLGVGECSTGPTVAAIANAIHDALGVRVRTMPFTAEAIAAAADI